MRSQAISNSIKGSKPKARDLAFHGIPGIQNDRHPIFCLSSSIESHPLAHSPTTVDSDINGKEGIQPFRVRRLAVIPPRMDQGSTKSFHLTTSSFTTLPTSDLEGLTHRAPTKVAVRLLEPNSFTPQQAIPLTELHTCHVWFVGL